VLLHHVLEGRRPTEQNYGVIRRLRQLLSNHLLGHKPCPILPVERLVRGNIDREVELEVVLVVQLIGLQLFLKKDVINSPVAKDQ